MKTLVLALLVCLCATPARADVISIPGFGTTGSYGTDFRWPSRPPQRVPEPGTLTLIALGAVAAVTAKRRARKD